MVFPEISLVDVGVIAAGMLALMGAVWALRKALGFLDVWNENRKENNEAWEEYKARERE